MGTISPGIELWDLDVLDAVEPVSTLGGARMLSAAAAQAPEEDTPKPGKEACPCTLHLVCGVGACDGSCQMQAYALDIRIVPLAPSAFAGYYDVSALVCWHIARMRIVL